MTESPNVSDCCGESIHIAGDTTHYFVCNKCLKSCDSIPITWQEEFEEKYLIGCEIYPEDKQKMIDFIQQQLDKQKKEIIEEIEKYEYESHKNRSITIKEQALHFNAHDTAVCNIKDVINKIK